MRKIGVRDALGEVTTAEPKDHQCTRVVTVPMAVMTRNFGHTLTQVTRCTWVSRPMQCENGWKRDISMATCTWHLCGEALEARRQRHRHGGTFIHCASGSPTLQSHSLTSRSFDGMVACLCPRILVLMHHRATAAAAALVAMHHHPWRCRAHGRVVRPLWRPLHAQIHS